MKICYQIKPLGKAPKHLKKHYLELNIPNPTTLENLLTKLVVQQYSAFREQIETPILPILSSLAINTQAAQGKIDFKTIYNPNLEDQKKAIEVALQAFEDGLFVVFIDDEPIDDLSTILSIDTTTIFTFIRLTFLTGSFW